MAYTAFKIPEESLYGELPESAANGENSKTYDLKKAGVPDEAKEVLVFPFATTKGSEEFHRLFYQIETTDGKHPYPQFMNVAASKGVSLNSANLWLPLFPGQHQVTVTLKDAEEHKEKLKSIAYREKKGFNEISTFSEFFVLGYR